MNPDLRWMVAGTSVGQTDNVYMSGQVRILSQSSSVDLILSEYFYSEII